MKTRVKICGITHLEDAQAALAAGADALGFVFSESPRQVDRSTAREIISQLPPFTNVVGVFVNEPLDVVQETIKFCGLSAVQLQGDESNDYCQQIHVPIIKGFKVGKALDVEHINSYAVSAYLLDTHVPGQDGGTGVKFDWRLLDGTRFARPLIIAGGLHADNVGELLRRCSPQGVDVSSGVSVSVRRKDPEKINCFMRNAATAPAQKAAADAQAFDILKDAFDQRPLVEIKGKKFLINSLTEQVPATPAALLTYAAQKVCDVEPFAPGAKLVGEEDKGGVLLAAVSMLSGLPFGIARWYPSGLEGQVQVNFDCEYTSGSIYLNGVEKGDKVYIVDDLVSTGGTLIGLVEAIRHAGAEVLGIVCVAEKVNYGGAERVRQATGIPVKSLVQIDISGAQSAVVGVSY